MKFDFTRFICGAPKCSKIHFQPGICPTPHSGSSHHSPRPQKGKEVCPDLMTFGSPAIARKIKQSVRSINQQKIVVELSMIQLSKIEQSKS